MHSDLAISSSIEDRADLIEGGRQRSVQEAGLLRWLRAKASAPAAPAAIRPTLLDAALPAMPGRGKARTLRQALADEGLDILPDPLGRFPCPKVARKPRSRE